MPHAPAVDMIASTNVRSPSVDRETSSTLICDLADCRVSAGVSARVPLFIGPPGLRRTIPGVHDGGSLAGNDSARTSSIARSAANRFDRVSASATCAYAATIGGNVAARVPSRLTIAVLVSNIISPHAAGRWCWVSASIRCRKFVRHSKYATSPEAMAPTPMITILTARRLLVSHTAAAPPSRTSVTLASATIHAILLFTSIPLLPAYMDARDGPDQTFYVIRKHLELTCREPEP